MLALLHDLLHNESPRLCYHAGKPTRPKGEVLAQSRFLTHTLVLLAAAFVPILTSLDRSHNDTVYGAANSAPAITALQPTRVDDVVMTQTGFILKVNAATVDQPARRDILYYTMKRGDTVERVAGQFGLTVDTVRWANNILDVTAVSAGQKLIIPPVNGMLIKVQPNTQLPQLAAQYKVQLQDVIDFNLIKDPEHLVAGTMLMLPDGQGPALPSGLGKHVVKSVTWSRFGKQQTTFSITYAGPAYGSGGHFPYGYCTWWVAHKRYVPWNGDAWMWWPNARLFGFAEGQTPAVGAIMVQGISWSSPVGHVAYVESVNADGSFTVSEMNYGRWGVVDYRTIKSTSGLDLLGFIY